MSWRGKQTPWFSAAHARPVRHGRYQVWCIDSPSWFIAHWRGRWEHRSLKNHDVWHGFVKTSDGCHRLITHWRGLMGPHT